MKRVALVIMTGLIATMGISCSSNQTNVNDGTKIIEPDWDNYEKADMSGYKGLEDYDAELMYRDITNTEVLEEMDKGASFIVYYGFSSCPWCNHMVGPLNDVALEENLEIAYVNTRRDSAWESNLDIDNYGEFSERFKDYLSEDDDGTPHLYAPAVYFIKNGKVISNHDGTVPSQEDSSVPLSEAQIKEYKDSIKEGIEAIKK